MDDELEVSLDGLLQQYDRQVRQIRDMERKLDEISVTATTKDGLVTVVLGARGRVHDVRLDPRVLRKVPAHELSRIVLELIHEATAEVSGRMTEIMGPMMPEDAAVKEIFGESVDFTDFLPGPVDLPPGGQGGRR